MEKIKTGRDDFMLRAMDVIADAEHRQLRKTDPKQIKDIASKLDAVVDERNAAADLRKSQEGQYEALYSAITAYLDTISKSALQELPEEVRREMENVERKIRKEREKMAAAEQGAPEPE